MFPENKTGKYFFPLSTIKKFHAEIVFVAWQRDLSWEVKIVGLFLLESTSTKFLILLLFYLPIFYCKYRLHLLLFSLIAFAFPACTCEPIGIQHPFGVFLRGVGPRCVGLARKISAHCNTGSYVFSFFFIFIFILFPTLSHMYVILIPSARSLKVGYEKSILTRTENFSINICFLKEPLLFMNFFLKRMCFYLLFISIRTWN